MKIQQKCLILFLLVILICISWQTVSSKKLRKRLNKTNHRKDLAKVLLIKRILGKGGFGKIFEATVENNRKQKYAIKAIQETKNNIKIDTKNEIKFLKMQSIDPTNMFKIGYYGTYRDEGIGITYIIMELMQIDMHRISIEFQLSTIQKLNYILQFAKNLKYLHSKNIAHRDLKLENLMLNKEGGLRIVDFGIAKTYTENYLFIGQVGTPGYLPIEMVENKPYSLKCDIFTFGLVAFEIMFNLTPLYYNDSANLKYNYKKLTEEAIEADEELKNILDLHDKSAEIVFFQNMFKYEKERISIDKIIQELNKWIKELNESFTPFKISLNKSKNLKSENELQPYFSNLEEYKYKKYVFFKHIEWKWTRPNTDISDSYE